MKSDDHLKNIFEYELAPLPPSLFDTDFLRKSSKSAFYKTINKLVSDSELVTLSSNVVYVIDGGFLLHKIVWPKLCSIKDILNIYKNYITKHYGT